MSAIKKKVLAYITHKNRLLIFRHIDFPEVGIQIPAGTPNEGEKLEDAVMREAMEETGLTELKFISFLGKQVRDMSDCGIDQIHERHFYHLRCDGNPPTIWQHYEKDASDGTPGPIKVELFWADLPDGVPKLTGGQERFISELVKQLPTKKGK